MPEEIQFTAAEDKARLEALRILAEGSLTRGVLAGSDPLSAIASGLAQVGALTVMRPEWAREFFAPFVREMESSPEGDVTQVLSDAARIFTASIEFADAAESKLDSAGEVARVEAILERVELETANEATRSLLARSTGLVQYEASMVVLRARVAEAKARFAHA